MKWLMTLFLMPALALAQTPYLVTAQCLPEMNPNAEITAESKASPPAISWNSWGACVRWYCYLNEFTEQYPDAIQRVTFCGTWTEVAKVSGRVNTIRKAKDPLKSLNDLGKRVVIQPLSDPAFAERPK